MKNIVIGKICIVIIVVFVTCLYIQKKDKEILESKIKLLNENIDLQDTRIKANKTEYEENIKVAKQRENDTKKSYEAKIKKLERWKKENENIKCEDSIVFINDYTF